MMMKNTAIRLFCAIMLLFSVSVWADSSTTINTWPPLNKVSYQFTASKWASTNTAKVVIGVNASLNQQGLAQIHQDIMQNLQKLAPKAQWHVTRFDRSQNQSGLEQLSVRAEARIPASQLASIRSQAKTISQAGQKYTVVGIQYTPSVAELQKTRAQLRAQIYAQARAELASLNKTFLDQKYYSHEINFNERVIPGPVQPRMMAMKVAGNTAAAEAMPVSNKVMETATVVLASRPGSVNN